MLKIESRAGKGQKRIADYKATMKGPAAARETNSRADGHVPGDEEFRYSLPAVRESSAAGDEGHGVYADDKASDVLLSSPPPFSADPRIQDIIALARNRNYWMQMRLRNTARVASELRRFIEPARGQEEEWSKTTKKLALAIVAESIEAVHHANKSAALEMAGRKPRRRMPKLDHPLLQHEICWGTAPSLADYEMREEGILQRMVAIAATLPIARFVTDCKGFSLGGLAVLIGHAGDFRDYPKKGHLWKRFGLAPFEKSGVTRAGSTWGRLGGLTPDDWTELGYKRSRLGDIFGKIIEPLFRAQWQTPGKDESGDSLPACAQGRYGEMYGRYKARQKALNETGAFADEAGRQAAAPKKPGRKPPQKALLEGRLPDSAIHSRALRYMAQKLVADLQAAWRHLGDGYSTE